MTTHTGLGSPTSPQGALQRLYEFADEANLSRGKHNIYFGGELDRLEMNGNWTIWNSGQFTFNGQNTSNHNAKKLVGGSDLADLLLGFPSSAEEERESPSPISGSGMCCPISRMIGESPTGSR